MAITNKHPKTSRIISISGSLPMVNRGINRFSSLEQIWRPFSLQHTTAKITHHETQQPRRHEDKTPQPRCQCVNNKVMDQSLNFSSLPSPLSPALTLLGSTDDIEVLVKAVIKLNGRCHVIRLHSSQAHSVKSNLLISKTVLAGLTILMRAPKVCIKCPSHLPC